MRVSEGGLRLDSQNYFFKILNELTNINFIFIKAKRKKVIIAKKLPKTGVSYVDIAITAIDLLLTAKDVYDYLTDNKKK